MVRSFSQLIKTLYLITLVLSPLLMPVGALNSGNMYNVLEKMETDIPININFWGYSDAEITTTVQTFLPKQVVHESYYPHDDKVDQWQTSLGDIFYGLQYNLNFNLSIVDATTVNQVKTILLDNKIQYKDQVSPINETTLYSGYAFPSSATNNAFANYSNSEAYTIHLLNFTEIHGLVSQNSTHWYRIGNTRLIPSFHQDFRNTLLVGERSILFDTSAIAPLYGTNQTFINTMDNSELIEHIEHGILDLIEKVILGSPSAFNYIPLEQYFHFAAITIGQKTSDNAYTSSSSFTVSDQVFDVIMTTIPYFKIYTSKVDIAWDWFPAIQAIKNDNLQNIDNVPTVVIDEVVADSLKNTIRDQLYGSDPIGYYYGLILMADNTTNYKYPTTNGLKEYEVGHLGVTMDDLDEFYVVPMEQHHAIARFLRLFGMSFGLAELSGMFSSQLDTPMTTIAISSSWDQIFSDFEKDGISRRLSVMYRSYLQDQIELLSDALDNSIFSWYKRDELQRISDDINEAHDLENNLDYVQAMFKYVSAYNDFEKEVNRITNLKNFVFNGAYLAMFVLILSYYVKILKEEAYPFEELMEKIKKLQKKN